MFVDTVCYFAASLSIDEAELLSLLLFVVAQIPLSHHHSSPNINGSLNNHQEQTNQLSPEGMIRVILHRDSAA